ncbi:MAG: ankyrin repeat domain-containing protein [Verrucomicrobiota bacterium]
MITRFLFIATLSLTSIVAETLPEDLLRQGLFEEEANRDFDKAAERYHAVVAAHDRQRSLAATATFRLGEIARKKNDKDAAAAAFRTVIARFPEQEDLARLSRENLTALGMPALDAPAAETPTDPFAEPAVPIDPQDTEIARLKEIARNSPDLLDGANEIGWRPMHHAAEMGQTKVIAYLLENKANPNSRTTREQLAPLHLASLRGRLGAVTALLAAGANIDATFAIERDPQGVIPAKEERANKAKGDWTALDLAVLYDRRETARALIAAGADLKRSGPDLGMRWPAGAADPFVPPMYENRRFPFTPLQLAVELKRDEISMELLKAGAPLTASDYNDALTPLQLAVLRHPDFTETLLKAKANPNLGFPTYGVTPLHDAANSGLIKVAKRLIDAGADLKAVDSLGRTPLHLATTAEMVDLLVSKGADPNARDSGGLAPLDWMVSREEEIPPSAVEALLKHGATVADAKALLQRTSLQLLPLVRDRLVYPKEQRPDAILLSRSGQGAGGSINPMEVRPAPGSPPPSLAEGMWPFFNGSESNSSRIANLRILRRKNAGNFETVLNWTPKKGDPARTEWPALEWGDIVELNSSNDAQFYPGQYLFSKVEPRSALFRLESWTSSPNLNDGNIWMRESLGNIPTDVAQFVDRTRISVIRKGVETPITVDLSQQMPHGFRLIDGDVVDLHFSENFWEQRLSDDLATVITQGLNIKRVVAGRSLVGTAAAYQGVLTDWSKVRIFRRGQAQPPRNVDLVAWVRSLPPRDQWDFEKIIASDISLQPGDVVMIPPSPAANDEARKLDSEISAKLREVANFIIMTAPTTRRK